MGSMLDAFERETFPAPNQRGYRRQPHLYRSLYEPSPYYAQPQPHLHLIDVSLPVSEPEEEHDALSVEEQLRAQLAQQKLNAAQRNNKSTNNVQGQQLSPAPQQGVASSALAVGDHSNSQQQQVAARDQTTEQDPLNSLFRSLFRPSSTQSLPAELQPLQKLRVDVSEDDSGITVQAEIAGLSKEDVQLTVQDHVLTISASKQSQREQHAGGDSDDGKQQSAAAAAAGKEPAEEKVKEGADNDSNKTVSKQDKQAESSRPSPTTSGSRILHRELYAGRVSRSLRLPRQADLSAISASCKDGLLTVRMPYKKSLDPEQRTIAIN